MMSGLPTLLSRLSSSRIDDAADPRRALSMLRRDCSPLGRLDSPGDRASILLLRPWRGGGGGGGGAMEARLLPDKSMLRTEAGRPAGRDDPRAGGGVGNEIAEGEVNGK